MLWVLLKHIYKRSLVWETDKAENKQNWKDLIHRSAHQFSQFVHVTSTMWLDTMWHVTLWHPQALLLQVHYYVQLHDHGHVNARGLWSKTITVVLGTRMEFDTHTHTHRITYGALKSKVPRGVTVKNDEQKSDNNYLRALVGSVQKNSGQSFGCQVNSPKSERCCRKI